MPCRLGHRPIINGIQVYTVDDVMSLPLLNGSHNQPNNYIPQMLKFMHYNAKSTFSSQNILALWFLIISWFSNQVTLFQKLCRLNSNTVRCIHGITRKAVRSHNITCPAAFNRCPINSSRAFNRCYYIQPV